MHFHIIPHRFCRSSGNQFEIEQIPESAQGIEAAGFRTADRDPVILMELITADADFFPEFIERNHSGTEIYPFRRRLSRQFQRAFQQFLLDAEIQFVFPVQSGTVGQRRHFGCAEKSQPGLSEGAVGDCPARFSVCRVMLPVRLHSVIGMNRGTFPFPPVVQNDGAARFREKFMFGNGKDTSACRKPGNPQILSARFRHSGEVDTVIPVNPVVPEQNCRH